GCLLISIGLTRDIEFAAWYAAAGLLGAWLCYPLLLATEATIDVRLPFAVVILVLVVLVFTASAPRSLPTLTQLLGLHARPGEWASLLRLLLVDLTLVPALAAAPVAAMIARLRQR